MSIDASGIRKSYDSRELHDGDCPDNPLELFRIWFDDAVNSDCLEPSAVCLSTVSADKIPSSRMVLFKGIRQNKDNREGFSFFTNSESQKGIELQQNNSASFCFYWDILERQVRIQGKVYLLPRQETISYFSSRPRESQLGALASQQSRPIATREALWEKLSSMQNAEGDITCPDYWNGYVLVPNRVVFWQGRPSRLHDRINYISENGMWIKLRLQP